MLYHFSYNHNWFRGEIVLLDSRALTKIQSIILVVVIVGVGIGGGVAYVVLSGGQVSAETIKIGICADLDNVVGKPILQGALLAAEQVNAEGGVLGRKFEIVAEDDDSYSPPFDANVAVNAFTKLITADKADFIVTQTYGLHYRETAYQHKKILFTVTDSMDELTQGVLDDYDRYKYCFRTGYGNGTTAMKDITYSIVACGNHTGFNKVAFIYHHLYEPMVLGLSDVLDEYGFEVVVFEPFVDVLDFSSVFAKVEASGAEILFPVVFGSDGISFVKEYYDRQSPMVMWGSVGIGSRSDFWELTEGKCEFVTAGGYPVVAGYPLTSKTVPTRDAYVERWGEEISGEAAIAYDVVRFILPDAIRRAGTVETEAVIRALEGTDVETSLTRRFVFTGSHDILMVEEEPGVFSEDYFFAACFQWQNGVMVPVYPQQIMEEAGATYQYPPWRGPWDK